MGISVKENVGLLSGSISSLFRCAPAPALNYPITVCRPFTVPNSTIELPVNLSENSVLCLCFLLPYTIILHKTRRNAGMFLVSFLHSSASTFSKKTSKTVEHITTNQ